jgi:hypothetical protein
VCRRSKRSVCRQSENSALSEAEEIADVTVGIKKTTLLKPLFIERLEGVFCFYFKHLGVLRRRF